MMTERENYLRALENRRPEWIPCHVMLNSRNWKEHRERLEEIVLAHPRVFPGHTRGAVDYDAVWFRCAVGELHDQWGCLWRNVEEGHIGIVVDHPLADWDALDRYEAPDPLLQDDFGQVRNWEAEAQRIREEKARGAVVRGSAGSLFDLMYALRGYDQLMVDIATGDPRLYDLIALVENHAGALARKWVELGVDEVYFHTDIGTQQGLMISPAQFREYIKPMFARLFQPVRAAGVHVRLSSDGRLLDIVDDLAECGVSVHDPQLRANTAEGIARSYRGRLCIDADLDRQLFPFCTPAEAKAHVGRTIETLHDPAGGLMVFAVMAPGVPLANIKAVCEAFEQYCF